MQNNVYFAASGSHHPYNQDHTINRISGGDWSDKRETFMSVLLSQFP